MKAPSLRAWNRLPCHLEVRSSCLCRMMERNRSLMYSAVFTIYMLMFCWVRNLWDIHQPCRNKPRISDIMRDLGSCLFNTHVIPPSPSFHFLLNSAPPGRNICSFSIDSVYFSILYAMPPSPSCVEIGENRTFVVDGAGFNFMFD